MTIKQNIYKCQDECLTHNKQYRHIVIMNTDRKNKEMKFVAMYIIIRNVTREINFALLGGKKKDLANEILRNCSGLRLLKGSGTRLSLPLPPSCCLELTNIGWSSSSHSGPRMGVMHGGIER